MRLPINLNEREENGRKTIPNSKTKGPFDPLHFSAENNCPQRTKYCLYLQSQDKRISKRIEKFITSKPGNPGRGGWQSRLMRLPQKTRTDKKNDSN
jgi:hypothetical protein